MECVIFVLIFYKDDIVGEVEKEKEKEKRRARQQKPRRKHQTKKQDPR